MNWDYSDYEYALSAALLVCAMTGMGATLTVRDFVQVFRSPRAILLTLFVQVILSPLLALALSWAFSLPPGISVGLLLIAALPGGLFSNLLSYLGNGNVALSVSATALCSLGCLVTTTLVLQLFAATTLPDNFSMPAGRILFEIAVCLLGPLGVGMAIRRWFPDHHLNVGKYCINASLVLLAIFIASALFAGRIQLTAYGFRAPLALLLFGIFSLWIAYGLGCLLGLPLRDSFTVGVEVVVRNAHLGVLLKAALFPAGQTETGGNELGDGVLFALFFYGAASLVIAAIEVVSCRRKVGLFFGWYARRLERRSQEAAESA